MSDGDNITLPREVVEKARKALTPMAYHTPPYERNEIAEVLRTALAAEKPSEDAERYRKQKERSYRLQRLLKECVKVMQANAVFRDTKAHKDLKTRIRAELEDKR